MGDAPVCVDTVGLLLELVTAGGDSTPFPLAPFPLMGLVLRGELRRVDPLLLLLTRVGLPCCFSWKGTVALIGCSRLPGAPPVLPLGGFTGGVGEPFLLTRGWDISHSSYGVSRIEMAAVLRPKSQRE